MWPPLSPSGFPGATFWRRLVHGVRRLHAGPELEQFAGADWPDRIMDMAVTDRLLGTGGVGAHTPELVALR